MKTPFFLEGREHLAIHRSDLYIEKIKIGC